MKRWWLVRHRLLSAVRSADLTPGPGSSRAPESFDRFDERAGRTGRPVAWTGGLRLPLPRGQPSRRLQPHVASDRHHAWTDTRVPSSGLVIRAASLGIESLVDGPGRQAPVLPRSRPTTTGHGPSRRRAQAPHVVVPLRACQLGGVRRHLAPPAGTGKRFGALRAFTIAANRRHQPGLCADPLPRLRRGPPARVCAVLGIGLRRNCRAASTCVDSAWVDGCAFGEPIRQQAAGLTITTLPGGCPRSSHDRTMSDAEGSCGASRRIPTRR